MANQNNNYNFPIMLVPSELTMSNPIFVNSLNLYNTEISGGYAFEDMVDPFQLIKDLMEALKI